MVLSCENLKQEDRKLESIIKVTGQIQVSSATVYKTPHLVYKNHGFF